MRGVKDTGNIRYPKQMETRLQLATPSKTRVKKKCITSALCELWQDITVTGPPQVGSSDRKRLNASNSPDVDDLGAYAVNCFSEMNGASYSFMAVHAGRTSRGDVIECHEREYHNRCGYKLWEHER